MQKRYWKVVRVTDKKWYARLYRWMPRLEIEIPLRAEGPFPTKEQAAQAVIDNNRMESENAERARMQASDVRSQVHGMSVVVGVPEDGERHPSGNLQ